MKEKYLEIRNILLNLINNNQQNIYEKRQVYKEYISQIRILAYKNNHFAQYDLAQHYEDFSILGNPNPFYNKKKRIYWYTKSAKNGNASAYNNLADLYERGDGCEKNLELALEYYKKSMDLGDNLGKINYKKMKKDFKKGGIYNQKSPRLP